MPRTALHEQLKTEMTYIPKDPEKHQSIFRWAYSYCRQQDLSENPNRPASESLASAMKLVKEKEPDANLHYDRDFFGEGDNRAA